jgi:hypothetical protein
MANFDPKVWVEIAPRFREIRGGRQVEKFLAEHDLLGVKWRMVEQGRQGTTVESLVKVCRNLDVSPTWLLLGIGPKSLARRQSPTRRRAIPTKAPDGK